MPPGDATTTALRISVLKVTMLHLQGCY